MPFAEPESSGRLNPRDIVGHLLLVWPTDYLPSIQTKFSKTDKPSDAVVVDVVDLDEADPVTMQPGCLYTGVWWLQSKLIQSLKRRIGSPDPILARMDKGSANPGMNAPFILTSATGDPSAVRRAETWLAANPQFQPAEAPERPQLEQPEPEPEPDSAVNRTISQLEKMARGQREAIDRLPPPPQERIPY